MNRKRVVLGILSSACLAASMLAGTYPASARSRGFGFSTGGGSGGIPTGPVNFNGIYGRSSAGGSSGLATGSTTYGASGPGFSTAGGSGGRSTGPTVR
jgi:hypothetical protein